MKFDFRSWVYVVLMRVTKTVQSQCLLVDITYCLHFAFVRSQREQEMDQHQNTKMFFLWSKLNEAVS